MSTTNKQTREKVFYIIEKIPDFLFTIVQILLGIRFLIVIFSFPPTNPAGNYLFGITTFLTLPLGLVLSYFIHQGTFLYEFLLTFALVPYALLYMLIINILQKIFANENE